MAAAGRPDAAFIALMVFTCHVLNSYAFPGNDTNVMLSASLNRVMRSSSSSECMRYCCGLLLLPGGCDTYCGIKVSCGSTCCCWCGVMDDGEVMCGAMSVDGACGGGAVRAFVDAD